VNAGRAAMLALCALLVPVLAGPAAAQIAPRLTGTIAIDALGAAAHDVSARAATTQDARLAAIGEHLLQVAGTLRSTLGNDVGTPVETLKDKARGRVLRAQAEAQRAQAYLDASAGCTGADTAAMTAALGAMLDRLAASPDTSAATQPVIDGVETLDKRPLFVIHEGASGIAFALTGTDLFDAQCPSPTVTATDDKGVPLKTQPVITGVLPNRIELKLPDGAALPPGTFALRVVPQHKAFLIGCTTQPAATAALQVAAATRFSVSYSVAATCGADGHAMAPVTGTLPDIGAATVAQHVDLAGCVNPGSYTITATVASGDGPGASVGPFTQSASAGITAGLPGGLSLSWDPSVQQIFVRPSTSTCKGVY
jgi:hypothetical protein